MKHPLVIWLYSGSKHNLVISSRGGNCTIIPSRFKFEKTEYKDRKINTFRFVWLLWEFKLYLRKVKKESKK